MRGQIFSRARRHPILPYLPKAYSTQSALVHIHNIPAPGTGRIRILSLNRPAARNAISRQLLHELRSSIDSILAEYDDEGNEVPLPTCIGGAAEVDTCGPTRALVLASEVDSSFCAGADLKERAGFTAVETEAFLSSLRDTFSTVAALPIPTIAAISSVALGGGFELALCTHMRVLGSTAHVGLPETRLGILPGAGGTYRLPGLIGESHARDLVLTGRRVGAPEAYFLGIADRLVELDARATAAQARQEVLRAAIQLAAEICQGAPVAIRSALRAVAGASEEVENQMYQKVLMTEDRNEALNAFKEKRRPVFRGR